MPGELPMSALLGALSLATDAANGVRPETALRTAVVAVELARRAALDAAVVRATYWTAMLRFLGCTSFAHETAALSAGDDRAMLAALQTVDGASPRSVLARALDATRGAPLKGRASSLARLVAAPKAGRELAAAHCAQAESLAGLLVAGADVTSALADLYERWDGKGYPHGKRGEALSVVARVVQVAAWAVAWRARGSVDEAVDAVVAMRGRALDPKLAGLFAQGGDALLADVERRVFERAMEVEPGPRWTCGVTQLDAVFTAFARFADLKSPFTLGHSTSVAAQAAQVGRALGLAAPAVERVRHAALLHDVGRAAVANGVWDAPGPLGLVEREQVRSHALHTERVLSAHEATRPLAVIASSAHERLDESGYPHARGSPSLEGRVLAVCDVATALREHRPHRAAFQLDAAVDVLHAEVRQGRLDREVVDAAVAVMRGARPEERVRAELSEREVEVLAQLARGASNKDIAAALGISPKTVQHHVAHVYEKTGVRSRAAAALYAVERGLVSVR